MPGLESDNYWRQKADRNGEGDVEAIVHQPDKKPGKVGKTKQIHRKNAKEQKDVQDENPPSPPSHREESATCNHRSCGMPLTPNSTPIGRRPSTPARPTIRDPSANTRSIHKPGGAPHPAEAFDDALEPPGLERVEEMRGQRAWLVLEQPPEHFNVAIQHQLFPHQRLDLAGGDAASNRIQQSI